MPWCNNCKQEYMDCISSCPGCGSSLSETLERTSKKESNSSGESPITGHLNKKLLFTAENLVQFSIITDALRKEKIPFVISTQKLWDHMQIIYTKTVVGEEVYVAEKDYCKAKEIYDYFTELKNSNSK